MTWLKSFLGGASGMSPQEAQSLIAAGALLLDVRDTSEWKAGHVKGARHLPLGELARRMGSLPKDRQIICVCRSGARSARATKILMDAGYDAVNLNGGMQAWRAVGLPIEASGGVSGIVA